MHAMNGHLTDDGRTLVVARDLPVGIDEAWEWVTDPERTARWYGPWSGEGRMGGTVVVTMSQEEGGDAGMPMRVDACTKPHLLALTSLGPAPYDWPLELHLSPAPTGTTVALHHLRLPADIAVSDIGPGWEFYLDRLVAAVEDREPTTFEELMADLAQRYAAL